jgi:hypothetical protein
MPLPIGLGAAVVSGLLVLAGAAPLAAPAAPTYAPIIAAAAQTAAPSTAVQTAIAAVIQRGNAEQQQALAAQDPTIMQDTATAGYYQQLAQTQQDLTASGVVAIRLVALQWGPISAQGTSAQATTYETWRTMLADGTIVQDRQQNVYTLVQEGGVWKIAADAQPGAASSGSGGTTPGAAPAPTLPNPSTGIGQSQNWSGYAATGGTFTGVSGTWTVPQVAANGSSGADATWVGIGGVTSHDLIQAGTQATDLGGAVRYSAWVETLPQPSTPVPLTVNPGDTVSVSITQQAAGTWQIDFQDKTTGQTYQTDEAYNSSLSSADWVEEAPAAGGGQRVVPLDSFGSVQFQAGAAVENGKSVTLAQAGAQPITMIDRYGQALAQPSALGSNGASFSVTETAGSQGGVGPSASSDGYGYGSTASSGWQGGTPGE